MFSGCSAGTEESSLARKIDNDWSSDSNADEQLHGTHSDMETTRSVSAISLGKDNTEVQAMPPLFIPECWSEPEQSNEDNEDESDEEDEDDEESEKDTLYDWKGNEIEEEDVGLDSLEGWGASGVDDMDVENSATSNEGSDNHRRVVEPVVDTYHELHPESTAGEPLPGVYAHAHQEYNNTDNIYAPFASKQEWEIANWSETRAKSNAAVDELLGIEGVCIVISNIIAKHCRYSKRLVFPSRT